jgi:carbonic anhydrase/acetyltransferase-like protein (isoleucine patch superfamily)
LCVCSKTLAMALRTAARTLVRRGDQAIRTYAAATATQHQLHQHAEWDYRGQRQIVPFNHRVPIVAVDAFVAPNVVLAGAVDIQDRASVWYGSVLRGDLNRIVLGFSSSVGDKCVLHAASTAPTGLSAETLIGKYCTIGSYSTLRSCTVEDEAVVGQRCVLMEGSLVEMNSMLGSGAVLPPGRRVPAGELWAGNPARFVRMLTNDEILAIPKLADGLRELAQEHMQEFLPYGTAYLEVEKLREKLKLPM